MSTVSIVISCLFMLSIAALTVVYFLLERAQKEYFQALYEAERENHTENIIFFRQLISDIVKMNEIKNYKPTLDTIDSWIIQRLEGEELSATDLHHKAKGEI